MWILILLLFEWSLINLCTPAATLFFVRLLIKVVLLLVVLLVIGLVNRYFSRIHFLSRLLLIFFFENQPSGCGDPSCCGPAQNGDIALAETWCDSSLPPYESLKIGETSKFYFFLFFYVFLLFFFFFCFSVNHNSVSSPSIS